MFTLIHQSLSKDGHSSMLDRVNVANGEEHLSVSRATNIESTAITEKARA